MLLEQSAQGWGPEPGPEQAEAEAVSRQVDERSMGMALVGNDGHKNVDIGLEGACLEHMVG